MNDLSPPGPPAAATPPPPDQGGSSAEGGRGLLGLIWAGLGIILNWFVIPLIIVLILHNFVFQAFHVVGSSMVPTLNEQDYLIVSKVDSTVAHLRQRGDANSYVPGRSQIIVFRYPRNPQLVFVKRVIGLPGDRVVLKDGVITVYNARHPEGFNPDKNHPVSDPLTAGAIDTQIPAGTVFVIGDNRSLNGSFDSREWGVLETRYIIGKAVLRLLPLDKFRIITTPPPVALRLLPAFSR